MDWNGLFLAHVHDWDNIKENFVLPVPCTLYLVLLLSSLDLDDLIVLERDPGFPKTAFPI